MRRLFGRKSAAVCYFDNVPPELLLHIFTYVMGNTPATMSGILVAICKRWRTLCMKSAKWSEIVLVRRLLVFMEYIVVGMKPDSKTYMSTIFIYDKSHLPHGVLRQTAMYSPDRGSDKPIGIDEWWPYNKTEWSVGWSTKKFWFAIHKSLE